MVFLTLKSEALYFSTLTRLSLHNVLRLEPTKRKEKKKINAFHVCISAQHFYSFLLHFFSFPLFHAPSFLAHSEIAISKSVTLKGFYVRLESWRPALSCSPSSLHPGPMQGSKSWVCRQGMMGSSCAFSILCLILRPLSQVEELQADHGDQFE